MQNFSDNYINREISWLSFNDRVLQEAQDTSVPLLERLKFLGIYSSNLDEFFSVRVGTLKRMLDFGIKNKSVVARSPKKTLDGIYKLVLTQSEKFQEIYENIKTGLEREGVFFVDENVLNKQQEKFLLDYFREEVRPRLVPVMLSSVKQFPYLKNQAIYLAIYLKSRRRKEKTEYALMEVPVDVLPRFVVLPRIKDRNFVIMLDDVIRLGLKEIFAIRNVDEISAYTIKLTRDAELDIDDDVTKSFFEKISKSLKQREKGQPVRFVYDQDMPKDLLEFILKQTGLHDYDNLIPGGRYHNARDFMNFPNMGHRHLQYQRQQPVPHQHIQLNKSMFETIRKRDILLHFPYQSFSYFIDLLREAAIDPKVASIKITLYRVAKKSNVINALINASRNGKRVTVNMELAARFDEEANIYWTRKLEEENIRIISGVPGLKVHSKLCLIKREEGDQVVQYAAIGTGNFNETTAQVYSDHLLMTCDKRLTKEVYYVFKFLETNYLTYNYKHLFVSPFFMRKKFKKLIANEIANAAAGKKACIFVKMNSLVDPEMIDQLYRASQAGVKIRMIVRGICSLIPGVKCLSENIEVVSILDKYLEHSRIFIFCNGGDEKIYISSADWMVRNLDNRVEVATPVYNEKNKQELKSFFEIQFRDVRKARVINQNQDNPYRPERDKLKYRAQEDLYAFLSKKLKGFRQE
jgi:polyphosphate kinase